MTEPATPPSTMVGRLRRFGPWLVGIAIVVAVVMHVPFAEFRRSLRHGPHLTLASVELLAAVLGLFTDAFATWIGLSTLRIRWPLARVTAVKGATYLLVLLNYAVGQGGFGYYLWRAGEPAKRAAGVTLFLLGTNLAALLVLAFATWVFSGARGQVPQMWWSIVAAMIAFGIYLCVIAVRIRFLANREILAPLFDAGPLGHAAAVSARLPQIVVIVLTYWVTMKVWGIDVPFWTAISLLPAVVMASVLPIAPAGLGTTQAAMVFLFARYVAGATPDERSAKILAFGIVHFVYGVLATALVGLVCITIARRAGFMTRDAGPATA